MEVAGATTWDAELTLDECEGVKNEYGAKYRGQHREAEKTTLTAILE